MAQGAVATDPAIGEDVTHLVGGGASADPPIGGDVTHLVGANPAATPPPSTLATGAQGIRATGFGERMADRLRPFIPSSDTQRLIGGGVGALAAGALAPEVEGPALALRGVQALIPVAGAALGGAGVAAAQHAPPSEVTAAGTTQAAYEAGGQALAWPLRAIGRRVLAHPVAKAAADALEKGRSLVNEQLDAALSKAEGAVRGTREGVARAVGSAKESARRAEALVGLTKQSAVEEQAKGAAKWPSTAPPPGSDQAAGQAVSDVFQGSAKNSLDQLGRAVDTAAQSGPAVDLTGVKGKLEGMAAKTRPSYAEDGGAVSIRGQAGGFTPEQSSAILKQLKDSGVTLEASHPLPGVLSDIQNAPDSVSFADAHILKRKLYDATNFESPAKGQVKQITKGISGTLRDAMAGHAPYDQATEAYQTAVPYFTKGVAKKVAQSAIDNPEAIVLGLKGSEPTKLQMLHEILTTHATAGGGAEEGQAAWNGVRSAWTYKNLIKGGVENFEENLAKVHPDFLSTMYGDKDGQQVLGNLKQISDAFHQAGVQGKQAVAGAKASAQAASDVAARTGEQGRIGVIQKQRDLGAVKEQVKTAKQPTKTEQAFQDSSLANTPPPSQLIEDTLHAGALHGANVFRTKSVARLLLGGPKVNDLVQWAAYSGPRTQMLVRAVTGPAPGMAIADLMRSAGMAAESPVQAPPMAVSHAQPAATPPPAAP